MQGAYQMNQGKSIFAQVMSLFPEYIFHQCVARYNGDRHKIKFTCRDQFMVMSFAQFTSQQSLRTNEAALTAFEGKLYHSSLSLIPRSTLADLNETKDWRIYLLSLRGSIPTFIDLTEGKVHDSKIMDKLPIEAL